MLDLIVQQRQYWLKSSAVQQRHAGKVQRQLPAKSCDAAGINSVCALMRACTAHFAVTFASPHECAIAAAAAVA